MTVGRREHPETVAGGDTRGEFLLQAKGIEPIAVDPPDDHRAADALQRGRNAAPVAADVMAVHRLGQHDVGSRVEAADELVGLMIEVALDGVAAARGRILVGL